MRRKPWVRNCSREREGLYNENVQQNPLCVASCVTKDIPVSPRFSPTFFYRRAYPAPYSAQFFIHSSPSLCTLQIRRRKPWVRNCSREREGLYNGNVQQNPLCAASCVFFLFFFSFISLIADGPHHYHPACGHKGSSHLSPVHALRFFYRDASSALLQLVNQWLNFTYSRSHAFRYERKNTNPTLVRIELTTSVLADVQPTY